MNIKAEDTCATTYKADIQAIKGKQQLKTPINIARLKTDKTRMSVADGVLHFIRKIPRARPLHNKHA